MKNTKEGKSIVVIILVLVIVAVLATALVLVLSGSFTSENQADSNLENEEVNSENKEEGNKGQASSVEMWIRTVKFPETTNTFDLALFDSKVTLPIDFNELEKQGCIYEYRIDKKDHKVKSIKDMTQKDDVSSLIMVKDSDGNQMFNISLQDVDKATLTHYERIKQGLYEVNLYAKDFASIFGLTLNDYDDHEDVILQKVVDTLGKPTYIYDTLGNFENDYNDFVERRSFAYNMVYEYEKFTIVFSAQEMIFNSNRHNTEITYIMYFENEGYKDYSDRMDTAEKRDILPLLINK